MNDWMIEWKNEWKNEWVNEWTNEWMNDWMIEWKRLRATQEKIKSKEEGKLKWNREGRKKDRGREKKSIGERRKNKKGGVSMPKFQLSFCHLNLKMKGRIQVLQQLKETEGN